MRIRDLWRRELFSRDLVRVFYVNPYDNIADFFAKVISTVHFKTIILKYFLVMHTSFMFLLILALL